MIRTDRPAAPRSAWRRSIDGLVAPAVGLSYFLAVRRFYPHDGFSLNPDEGANSMKALLVDHGYRLYDQIWSDQPPLFTHLLRAWFDAFGADVMHGRHLVLFFAALLVCGLYDLLRGSWNHVAAVAAVVLLASSAYFLPLSVSLMIGVPSLSCATLSLCLLVRWRRTGSSFWLGLSGIAMGLSIGIKLFTAFLIPVYALWLLFVPRFEGGGVAWRPALAWLFAVGFPTVLSIAAAPCAGIAVAALFEARTRLHRADAARSPLALRLVVAAALLLLALALPISRHASRPVAPVGWDAARDTLAAMRHFRARTRFVLTDAPMYAFRSGLPTVPRFAVMSLKRKETHNLTTEDLLAALEEYAPEQVLLTNQLSPPAAGAVTAALSGRYDLVFDSKRQPARLYVRNDILDVADNHGPAPAGF